MIIPRKWLPTPVLSLLLLLVWLLLGHIDGWRDLLSEECHLRGRLVLGQLPLGWCWGAH